METARESFACILARRQRLRRASSSMAALIADPTSADVTLPAGGRFAVRNAADLSDTTAALTIGDRTISVGAGVAGMTSVVDWLPQGAVVNIASGFTLLFDNGMGRWVPIGEKS